MTEPIITSDAAEEAIPVSRYRSIRINVLLSMAYITIIICLAIVVFLSDLGEYAQGILTLVLGRFLGYVDQVYAFEFGTTASSKTKDEAINNLTKGEKPQ